MLKCVNLSLFFMDNKLIIINIDAIAKRNWFASSKYANVTKYHTYANIGLWVFSKKIRYFIYSSSTPRINNVVEGANTLEINQNVNTDNGSNRLEEIKEIKSLSCKLYKYSMYSS